MPYDHSGWTEDGWDEPLPSTTYLNPKEEEQALRDHFIAEYMRDFSPINAAIRCGHIRPVAEKIADRYMGEPYVLRNIQQRIEELDLDPDGENYSNMKRQVIVGLKCQANYHGSDSSHAARINALNTTAKLLGMEPEKKTSIKLNTSGVMAVPGIASIEDWEQFATESQNRLLDETQNDDE